jgi:hypothetical protein
VIAGPLVLLLLQGSPALPLVGDTVWVEREVRAPAGSLLRPLPWTPGEVASLLGPPEVEVRPGGWLLRYPLVFWRAGTHRLVVPGPLVIREDGGTDSLPSRAAEVTIASLLPRAGLDTLPPEPPADLIPAGERTLQPMLLLMLLAAAGLAPVHWFWRRRGVVNREPLPGPIQSFPPPVQLLDEWAGRGEWRAAADGWIARLEGGPAGPEREDLVAALRAARVESEDTAELARLCHEASTR